MNLKAAKLVLLPIVLMAIIGCNNPLNVKPYKMAASSMQPTINKGDRIIADFMYYKDNIPKRGDIIVFRYPKDPEKHWVKRILALGGETIEIKNGSVFIDGKAIEQDNIKNISYTNAGEYGAIGKTILVPENNYFVLGDNSTRSLDSRYWGFLPKENIIAKVTKRYWPINRIGSIE
ncbi:MAG: signal peptidase I [Pseudomonadota bacterium]